MTATDGAPAVHQFIFELTPQHTVLACLVRGALTIDAPLLQQHTKDKLLILKAKSVLSVYQVSYIAMRTDILWYQSCTMSYLIRTCLCSLIPCVYL